MIASTRPIFASVLDWALRTTGAAQGWLLAVRGNSLQVVAASGPDAEVLLGSAVAPSGARGYCVASGQPAALRPGPADRANAGAGGSVGTPASVLAAPCGENDVLGVLEVVSKHGDSASFSIDDIEMVTMLAELAGAAMAEEMASRPMMKPETLVASLGPVAASDPELYGVITRVVHALLAPGA